ncbi:MAG: hypothetical protein WD579_01095, partial [Candidatus Paceibacterota bacterium]
YAILEVGKEWMKGGLTSEEINEEVAELLGLEYETVMEAFITECSSMNISQKILDLIQELRGTYTVVITTNHMDCMERWIIPAHNLLDYVDGVVNSYNEGVMKVENGGEFFKVVFETYGGRPEDSIVIDDSRDVLDLFESLGGVSYQATSETPLMYWLKKIKDSLSAR